MYDTLREAAKKMGIKKIRVERRRGGGGEGGRGHEPAQEAEREESAASKKTWRAKSNT